MTVGEEKRKQRAIAMFREVAADRVAKLNLLWLDVERRAADTAPFLREAHTLKGEASLTGFVSVARLVHVLEDYVKSLRVEGRPPGAADGDLVLGGLELVVRLSQRDPAAASPEGEKLMAQVEAARTAPAQPSLSTPPIALAGDTTRAQPEGPVARREAAIRVSPDKIDRLLAMVSELLLSNVRWRQLARSARRLREAAESETGQTIRGQPDHLRLRSSSLVAGLSDLEARLRDESHALERFIGDFEATTRDLRMVPLGTLLEQFPLPLRQLARTLGREVRFTTVGEQTEVDKALLELLAEPLLHLLRNAVDHGVEPPAERAALGKPAEACVRVAAGLVGQRLHLEVADDGRGIDVDAVRRAAVACGLLDEGVAAAATKDDLLRVIFAAGFSTRPRATEISGRGLGLNIVLDAVENVGGKIDVRSEVGRGTTFDIEVPLSVAITRVVLFRVGLGTYALPAASVRALLGADSLTRHSSDGGFLVDYAGARIPLLDLAEILDEPVKAGRPPRIVIAQSGSDLVALAGSEAHLEREAMLKPMGRLFEHLPLVPAAVNVEEGGLALVLKVAELVLLARMRSRRLAGPGPAPSHSPVALVADDSPVVREVIAQGLRAHGVQVVVAADGEEALALLADHARIDVVVTDIDMPRLDGLALVRALRSQPSSSRVPVVAISMHGDASERQAALAAGVSAYIDKGDFDQVLLWQTVGPLVGSS